MSVKNQTVVAKIQNVKRLASSDLGNPRYALVTDKGTFKTPANSSIGYMVCGSWEGRTIAIRFDGRSSMRSVALVTDEVSVFAAVLVVNGVREGDAIRWANANGLRAKAYEQGELDDQAEAELVNGIYADI